MGRCGLNTHIERDEMLANFCRANNMMITNTLFQQPPRRTYTGKSPGDQYRNQIDYILVDKAWQSTVPNAHSRPRTDGDTDHILLTANMRLKTFKLEFVSLCIYLQIDGYLHS